MIFSIGYVHHARPIDRNAPGKADEHVELSGPRTPPAPLPEEDAVARELLHPLVRPVGHVHHAARLVHRDGVGRVELAGAAARIGPRGQERPIEGELLYPIGLYMGRIQGPVMARGDTPHAEKLIGLRTETPPRKYERPVTGK